MRLILEDYNRNGEGKRFEDYYADKGEQYFYDFLKHLSEVENLTAEDFIDWGNQEKYKKEIGVGECAGVVVDLVATLFFESQEKIDNAHEAIAEGKWAASIYHSYQSMVNSAKALLISEKKKVNTHAAIVADFDTIYVDSAKVVLSDVFGQERGSFAEVVYQLNQNEPTEAFAKSFAKDAKDFLVGLEKFRALELENA